MARSSQDALRLLNELGDNRVDHLWLDHDLVGEDTIRPVVEQLVQRARAGSRLDVRQIHIHSSNVGAGHWMGAQLRAAGYPVIFSYALAMWTRVGRSQHAERHQRRTLTIGGRVVVDAIVPDPK